MRGGGGGARVRQSWNSPRHSASETSGVSYATLPAMTRVPFPIVATLSLMLLTCARLAAAQPAPPPALPYDTLFYTHDGLTLEAYLYKPEGAGPFPLVVYNHGSAV